MTARFVVAAFLLLAALTPTTARAESVVLRWTAPGDDGTIGQASEYELRFSQSPVNADTVGWWGSAIAAGPVPTPLAAGSRESFTVAGLDSGQTYYFIIRAADEVPNWSGYSNVVAKVAGAAGGSLATPSHFLARAITGGVLLTWDEVLSGGGLGYKIYRRQGTNPLGSLVLTAPPTQTTWNDMTVLGGETYEYTIVTYSNSTESAPATTTISIPPDLLATATTALTGYPNPARGKVTFRFHSGTSDGQPAPAKLIVYDLNGRKICELANGLLPAGEQALEWACRSDKGNPVAPGLYNAILDTPAGRQVIRLALVP